MAALAHRRNLKAKVEGKGFIPLAGELSVGRVAQGIKAFLGGKAPIAPALTEFEKKVAELAPPRPPVLCAGCLHRNVFLAMNRLEKKLGKDNIVIKPSDIGCYTLGYQPPLNAVDTNFCMGAGVGVSSGFARFSGQKVVATIGDSTFYHAGIPPLINAVMNNADIIVALLDNGTTAMTGHQPHPGAGRCADGSKGGKVDLETMVRACGVAHVDIVPGWDIAALTKAFDEAAGRKGVSVVIARQRCVLLVLRERRAAGRKGPVCTVAAEKCKGCFLCINRFGCPAMKPAGKKMEIDPETCAGCGACLDSDICPEGAIQGQKGGLEK